MSVPPPVTPESMTHAEKAARAKMENAYQELARTLANAVGANKGQIDLIVNVLFPLAQAAIGLNAITEMLMERHFVSAVPNPVAPPDDATAAPFGLEVEQRLTWQAYFERCADRAERQASAIMKGLLSSGIAMPPGKQ